MPSPAKERVVELTDSPEIVEDTVIASGLEGVLVKARLDTDLKDHGEGLDSQLLPEGFTDGVIWIHEVMGQDDHLDREGNDAPNMQEHPWSH